ncbi:hypothetical protein [Paenibacillus oleatilyticus]|uniref:hypothetical protein n=1 Tax=Paenibacillus oleatilyticus TaxID=2594886 RepID=UPI001C1F84BB|nr:hypothetical protein [Paenibacillus oleatilyticus]MBU7320544.1 hypothetical protein [Paenibacillus oleatilyticus]
MDNNVVSFPIGFYQMKKNELGERFLPCEVSGRWMEIVGGSRDNKFIIANVMTLGSDDEERKICELILHTKDIINLAEHLKENKN